MIEYILLSLRNLSQQKTRAFLTLLGVIIGITAIVAMISIGEGMKYSLEKQLKTLGSDKILVFSTYTYGAKGKELTDEDARLIEDIVGVEISSPLVSVVAPTKFRGEEKLATIWALEPAKSRRTFAGVSGYELMQGRWLRKGDKYKIAIGYKIHDDFYDRKVNLGNTIEIRGKKFQVVGIFEKTGDADSDSAIYADIDQIREIFGMGNRVTMIIVRTKEGYDVEEVAKKIENVLEKSHKEKDFQVFTPKQVVEQVGKALAVVQIVFGGIASVSLLVGAIGIANTMLMNVIERTREIGIMKATGATNKRIIKIFLAEAGAIGMVGGGIGVAFGYIISKIINKAADKYLGEGILVTKVSLELAVFALLFSLIVGIISGIYPAKKASELDPVVALRS